MSTLLIAPHADDETLFAAYLAQRYAAHVVVVYDERRQNELAQATSWLGCTYQQLGVKKGAPANVVEGYLQQTRNPTIDRVIVPAVEEFGHEEHNLVGEIAPKLYPGASVIAYRTYSPRGTRSHGTPSEPDHPDCIARKLAALSCYRSQILGRSTRPWFYDLLDMREWTL